MSFIHPNWLIGLAPLAAFVAVCWWFGKSGRKHAVAPGQLLVGAALLFALTAPFTIITELVPLAARSPVDVIDVSPSHSPRLTTDEDGATVYFASTAATKNESRLQAQPPESNIASGLALAIGQPRSGVLLHTDGRETQGNSLASVRGIDAPVSVLAGPVTPDMRLVGVRSQPGRPDRDAKIFVEVESNVAAEATLHITFGAEKHENAVVIPVGRVELEFQYPAKGQTEIDFRATLDFANDGNRLNNSLRGVWFSTARPILSLVSAPQLKTDKLEQHFEKRGWQVDKWNPQDVTEAKLKSVAAMLILGRTAGDFDASQHELIESFAAEGGGLAIVGGTDVYGADALGAAPWREYLPVDPSNDTRPVASRPSFAMVLIIDVSGSMENDDRLGMAKQAARQTVELLDPADQVGVLTFSTITRWVNDIQPSGNKKQLLSRIDALKVENDTNLGPAIEKAELALAAIQADRKHLILLTDGVSSPGDFSEVATRLRDGKVSVATVSVSAGAEQLMLKDIARLSNGRHYHCEDAEQLPTVLVRETKQAVGALKPTLFAAFELEGGLDGVPIQTAPPLTDSVVTTPKPNTVLAYLTSDGQPLIVWRPHGKGQVASLVCSADELLGESWTQWTGFTSFWDALVRKVERPTPPDPVEVRGEIVGDRCTIHVDLRTKTGQWDSNAEPHVSVGTSQHRMRLSGPGRYTAAIPVRVKDDERFTVSMEVQQGSQTYHRQWGGYRRYDDEQAHVGEDRSLLNSLAAASGGKVVAAESEAIYSQTNTAPATKPVRRPWWPAIGAGAVIMLLLETLLRRWSIRFGADR